MISTSNRKDVRKMPEWNPMQLKAIQTKERNILVSASAGSGKTTVLIARLMDLVMKDHVSIDSILAMTFTEAAANEMKTSGNRMGTDQRPHRRGKKLYYQTADKHTDSAYFHHSFLLPIHYSGILLHPRSGSAAYQKYYG